MELPVVSIICLCYNHEAFVNEALRSIENLTYPNLEVLVADDFSTDHSVELLKKWQLKMPEWKFNFNEKNLGNCRTFNQLLKQSTGEFVLDFATDDVLESTALEAWVTRLSENPNAAFSYADAWLFEKSIDNRRLFSASNQQKKRPEGKILPYLFGLPFICPPAVLFRRSALLEIGGYNENLAYEDWNVWLHLARKFEVVLHTAPVINYRIHPSSLSASVFQNQNSKLIDSTLAILNEVLAWEEVKSIPGEVAYFIRYHLKICAVLEFRGQGFQFWELLCSISKPRIIDWFWFALIHSKIPVYWIFKRLKSKA